MKTMSISEIKKGIGKIDEFDNIILDEALKIL